MTPQVALMELVDDLAEIAAPPGLAVHGTLRLRRAWPRGAGHVLVEYEDEQGRRVAGQRIPQPERFERVVRATAAQHPELVATVPQLHLLLQSGGADRKLVALRELVSRDGSELIVHRPERRAVVRLGDGRWAKVVRPDRMDGFIRAATTFATARGVVVPRLLEAQESTGCTLWSHVPGTPLITLHGRPGAVDACRSVGAAVRRMHDAIPPSGVTRHGAAGEQLTLRTWTERVRVAAPAVAARMAALVQPVAARLADGEGPLVLAHGDLHDRQILVDEDRVGIIDADMASLCEPAQDLANLLVHLQLRGLQGQMTPPEVHEAAAAVLAGYAPAAAVRERLAVYAASTRLRLAAVYRLRPSGPQVSTQLLELVDQPVPGM